MKKVIIFAILVAIYVSGVFAQNNVTNNTSITINGNVYYFRPSTTPSSPLPNTPARNFIGEGHWYGADAARAWASISDWAIEHCFYGGDPIKPGRGEVVYIHQVHAVPISNKNGLDKIDEAGLYHWHPNSLGAVKIYYWVVSGNEKMEDGHRRTRTFWF